MHRQQVRQLRDIITGTFTVARGVEYYYHGNAGSILIGIIVHGVVAVFT